jgi:hypothetical protein
VRERAAVSVLDGLLDGTAFLIDEIDRGVLPFDEATTHTLVGELRSRRRLVEG